MRFAFLRFTFNALLLLLWALFATCTGLSYWTPMRTLPTGVPITISPLHWIAVWSYVAALAFVAAFQLTAPVRSYSRLLCSIAVTAVLFTATAVILENQLFFNAHDSEKSQTAILVFGCGMLAACAAVLSTLVLAISRYATKRA